ncbi:hypothetical protein HNQ07_001506 [Deinococcus metalli]|uniref:Peripheral subunit-binding (PSBD) domain-containing protein n=1 Tax=Deinococcus metalli TaxID=1141878 RepID=A0A7W8KGD3_9DEIO|nr:E3 binding domain-containing protein [Deinococcus metalli]MBB5376049.1 hypothetical protein [Deinococcus metalli]GHF41194.1 hypothetical protein GCM10017781_17340 [Deinococcus metalli]
MERIAPLAKILAEANGIDWQQLKGTGDGGMIVEQDILNYLSRIMSGEEEPPATPVDLPPPDWNGDVNSMPDLSGVSADQMARAGVEADLTALLGKAPVTPPSPEVPATAPAALDDDLEFELDDAEPSAPVPAPPAVPATPSLGGWEWSAATPAAPAAVPTVEVPAVQVPDVAAPAVSAPAFHFDAPVASVPAPAVPAPAVAAPVPAAPVAAEPALAAPSVGLGGLLSRLYQQPTPAAPAPAPAPVPVASPAVSPPMDTTEDHSGPELDTGVPAPMPAAAEPAPAHHVPAPDILPAVAADEPALVAAPHIEAPAPEPEPVAAAPDPEPQPEVAAPDVVPTLDAAPVAVPAAPEHAAAQPTGNAVWFGTYLRRDSDVGALSDLHGQLVAALGRELPLGLLVARAAQRHAADLGLTTVALHGQDGARSVAGDTLRAAADAAAYAYEGTPDLLIVDAGAHDLDDLHFPQTTTLSLGRVQDGRAALSLNGDVDAARGAAFLTAVAQTLGQPVLLLL